MYDFNRNVLNLNVTYQNDKIHDTTFNATIQILKHIYDWKIDFMFYLAVDDSGRYSKELFRTQINVTKVLLDFRDNILLAPLVKGFIDAFDKDFELKFPLKPRNYTVKNYTVSMPLHMFPPIPVRFMAEVKHWMRLSPAKRIKKMEFAVNLTFYGKLSFEKMSVHISKI